jgi:uncharacterized protein YkwD
MRRTFRCALLVLGAALLAMVAACTPGQVRSAFPGEPAQGVGPGVQNAETARMEQALLAAINAERREHGLAPLQDDPALSRIARAHSRRMGEEGFFAHADPAGRGLVDRIEGAGIRYRQIAENISRSRNVPDPVSTAVRGWMQSAGHRRNILQEGFTHSGVGIWREGDSYFFTQVFLQPADTAR